MYSLSTNEFALLNNNQKIKVCENLQNFIESEKQKYFKNFKNDKPIRPFNLKDNFSYIKKNSKNYKLIEDNDLLYSSSISSFNNENENKIKIINKAKNDIREYKKELERLKIKPKYAIEENNKNELNTINGELNTSNTIQEINYIIESTTNSFDSSQKRVSINKNYITKNPLNIDYIKKFKTNKFKNIENYNINFDKLNENSHHTNSLNYNYNIFNKSKSNKSNLRNEEYKYNNNLENHLYYDYNNNYINKNSSFHNHKYNNNKLINSIKRNKILKPKEKKENLKIDIKEKFEKEYIYKPYINQSPLYNENNNNKNDIIKRNLSFDKKLITDKKNNQSRNIKENISIKYKSLSNRNKINYLDVGNRLYNMHQVIIDKINKKKMEIEQKEISDCSFIPKINNKSRKMMEKIKNRKILKLKEKYEKLNNNDINKKRKNPKENYSINEKIPKNQKSKIIDLIPRYKKSNTFINKSEKYINNISPKYKNENEEIKECSFKPKINKNYINYCRNNKENIKTKYNTIDIDMHNSKENKDKYEKENINKPNNIKQSFLFLNDKRNNYFRNEKSFNLINNNNNYFLEKDKLMLYKDDIVKDNKENLEYYYYSKFNLIDKKNEDNKFVNSLQANLTESNSNYYLDNNSFHQRAISAAKSKNYLSPMAINEDINFNKYMHPNSFKYFNENKNLSAIPRIYKNKNNIAKFSKIGNAIPYNKNYSFKKNNIPIKLREKEGFLEKLKLNEYNKLEERNLEELMPKKMILTSNNSITSQSFKNNFSQNHNEVYIKKICRDFSYTNRNNKININDNSKLLNNRMIIKKLLLEE